MFEWEEQEPIERDLRNEAYYDGYDDGYKQAVIDKLVVKLEKDMPSRLDFKERYGYTVALTIIMEQLKEQKWT